MGPAAPSAPEAPGAVSAVVQQDAPRFAPGKVLVRFQPGAAAGAVAAAGGVTLSRELGPGIWLGTVGVGAELAAAAALARNPNVLYAEPDYLRTFDDPLCPTCERPQDDLLEWQWNMHNDGDIDLGLGLVFPTEAVDADIDWLEAYDLLGPSPAGSVRIGILDTGVRSTHVDICGKVLLQRNFYDPQVPAEDDHGHGSHVAGVAGACAGGHTGVVGVAYGPDMRFLVGKVCAADGTCAVSGIVEGLYWMAENGANVLNMSFGDVAQSQAEADALQAATDAGVLSFCAAGNDPALPIIYPAADPNCVAVTATNFGDRLASYSSSGPQAELSAPGGDLEDLFFGTSMIVSAWAGFDTDYVATVGTSMATPHATGLGGLLYALGITDPAAIRSCLRSTADDLGAPGWDQQFGWGRINMVSAVQAVLDGADCTTPPPPPPARTMHVASLDGWSEAAKGNRWQAFLEVGIADADGAAVAGATVTVSWSGAATGGASATTGSDGVATFSSGGIRGGAQVTFVVGDVTHPTVDHDAGADIGNVLAVLAPQPPNQAPAAAFTAQCSGRVCAFVDGSTDPDGSIALWSWAFGDGATSSASSPSHAYAADGAYDVTLTVTDDRGATDASTRTVTVPPPPAPDIVLAATGTKVKGNRIATLSWTGAALADVYRDGQPIASGVASPFSDDTLGKGGGSFTYRVCAAGSAGDCSNEVTVAF